MICLHLYYDFNYYNFLGSDKFIELHLIQLIVKWIESVLYDDSHTAVGNHHCDSCDYTKR